MTASHSQIVRAEAVPVPERPDVTAALAWRDWPAALDEAAARGVPILALAEPPWTNSAQRLAFVLAENDGLRRVLEERFVPTRLDPVQRPDLVARWRWSALALTGSCGPPLLLFLTAEGLPFLSYGSMFPDGDPLLPTLASLAASAAETYAAAPATVATEARGLVCRAVEGAPSIASAADLWRAVVDDADLTLGGFRERPKHPHPQLLMLLLDLPDRAVASDARRFVMTTLRAMMRGGIHDQLGGGFHRCSRDERWIVPHFEKPLPLNAQLASLYARAARIASDNEFQATADTTAAFCVEGLRDGIDAVGSDSRYYTWTAQEFLDHLPPELIQAVSLHYAMTPGGHRHVLYRAVEPEEMEAYSDESPELLRDRIETGRRLLAAARDQRRGPEMIQGGALSWHAETLCWLFDAAAHGADVDVTVLESALDRLAFDLVPGRFGSPRADRPGETTAHWVEDQASLLAALVAAHRATHSPRWLSHARLLADVVVDHFRRDEGGLDRPEAQGGNRFSVAVADDVVPAPIATLTAALHNLSAELGDARYAEAAQPAAADGVAFARAIGWWSGAFWRAWFHINAARAGNGQSRI